MKTSTVVFFQYTFYTYINLNFTDDSDHPDPDSDPPANKEDYSTDIVKETVGAGSIKRRIAHNPSVEV